MCKPYLVDCMSSDLEMPSKQYHLDVKNSSIGSLDVDASVVTALDYGDTDVVLKDRCILVLTTRYVLAVLCNRTIIKIHVPWHVS